MNRYKLSKAGISANEGIKRFGGNAEKYEELLNQFPDDIHFKAMCDAIAEKNVQKAFNEAHALKGISGNLSMKRFYEDLFPLVEELRGGSLENADTLLQKVKQDYDDALAALDKTK